MFSLEAPSDAQIDTLIRSIEAEAEDEIKRILITTAAATVGIISKAYEVKIYQQPPGVFGRPKDAGKPLAQAVQYEVTGDGASVFTNKKEAGYLEFGTGIYNTVGTRKPITPKRASRLAYPFWTLPPDFKGMAIYRQNVRGSIPAGAKGLVLSKKVDGIKPVPVWFNPATLKAIDRVLEQQIGKSFS